MDSFCIIQPWLCESVGAFCVFVLPAEHNSSAVNEFDLLHLCLSLYMQFVAEVFWKYIYSKHFSIGLIWEFSLSDRKWWLHLVVNKVVVFSCESEV